MFVLFIKIFWKIIYFNIYIYIYIYFNSNLDYSNYYYINQWFQYFKIKSWSSRENGNAGFHENLEIGYLVRLQMNRRPPSRATQCQPAANRICVRNFISCSGKTTLNRPMHIREVRIGMHDARTVCLRACALQVCAGQKARPASLWTERAHVAEKAHLTTRARKNWPFRRLAHMSYLGNGLLASSVENMCARTGVKALGVFETALILNGSLYNIVFLWFDTNMCLIWIIILQYRILKNSYREREWFLVKV